MISTLNPFQHVLDLLPLNVGPGGQHAEIAVTLSLASDAFRFNADQFCGGYYGEPSLVEAARFVIDFFATQFPANKLSQKVAIELNSAAQR